MGIQKDYDMVYPIFFIPVIPPYKIDYIKQCRICNVAARIDKEEASPGDSGSISSKDEDSGLTDVQKNYRDEMAALKKKNNDKKSRADFCSFFCGKSNF